MIICPRCGHQNQDKAKNCYKCDINLKYAIEHAEDYLENGPAKEAILKAKEDKLKEEAISQEKYNNFILTTTPSIERKEISHYLGITTSVVVLGTGMASEISASISDLLGTRSGTFQEKLHTAIDLVLSEMKDQAFNKGGDGIVGLSLDYMTFQGNMIMVTGTGTIVKLVTK